jgi:hypothetical protein
VITCLHVKSAGKDRDPLHEAIQRAPWQMRARNEGYGLKKAYCWSVQNQSATLVKIWSTAACASKAPAAIRVRRGSSIVGIAHRNGYAMNVYGERRDVDAFAKSTVLGALKEGQGSVRRARTCLLNAPTMVSLALLRVNYTNYTDCCARRLLAIQPDFVSQQCEIEERIRQFPGSEGRHQVMYYPKFHCELNHIEYFWCHSKRHARENCDYSIEGLRKAVPLALQSVKTSTILGNYKSCMKKMEIYRRGIRYGTKQWRDLTSHQKVYVRGEDR